MKTKHTQEDILNTASEGFYAVQHLQGWPKLDANYVMGITDGALLVTLTTGQTFRITCKELKP